MTPWYSRKYRGATQSEALIQFTADAQAAEQSGFRPALQSWHEIDGSQELVVAYKHVSLAPRAPNGQAVPNDERIASFRRVLGMLWRRGCTIEQQWDYGAIIVRGRGLPRRTHLIHAFLTFGTVGIWGIVWLFHHAKNTPWRRDIVIDELGTIAAGIHKPGATKPPRLGPPVSGNGLTGLPQRQRLITLLPGVPVTAASTLLCELEGEQVPTIRLESVDKLVTRYHEFEIFLSANAEPGTKLAWFVLN